MPTPFPTAPVEKKALHAEMTKMAPDFMQAVADIRKQFPGAKLTYFKSGEVEYGQPSMGGWEIPENVDIKALQGRRKQQVEAEKARIQKAKARRSR